MTERNATVVLSNRLWLDQARVQLGYVVALAVIVLLPVALAIILARAGQQPGETWAALLVRLAHKLAAADWSRLAGDLALLVLTALAIAAQLVYAARARRLERLTLSPEGMRYTSALPAWAKALQPDWFLAWSEVRHAGLAAPPRGAASGDPRFVVLTLTCVHGKRRIAPAQWVEALRHESRPRPTLSGLTLARPSREEALRAVLASEVMRYLAEYLPQLAIESPLGRQDPSFLEQNRHGRVAIGVVTALLVYAVLDGMAGPWSYVDAPLAHAPIYIVAGVLAALLSGAWLAQSKLRRSDQAGLALLIGVVSTAAMVPGALRINALTAPAAATSHTYYVAQGQGGIVLRPAEQGLPAIDYFAQSEYWAEVPTSEPYPVELRRGALGFYQFNSSAVVDELRRRAGE